MALILAAVLCGGAPRPATAGRAAGPAHAALDRGAYVQLLHQAFDEVTVAQAATGAARDAATARALADLPAGVTVQDAGGPLAAADLSRPRAALLGQPPDLAAAHTALAALIDLLDPGSLPSPSPSPVPTSLPGTPAPAAILPSPAYVSAGTGTAGPPLAPGDAGRRLDGILADPRFQADTGNGIQRGLADALAPAVSFFLGLPSAGRDLLIGAVAGLLVTFMIYSGYRAAPWSRRRYWSTVIAGGLGTTVVVFLLLMYLGVLLALLAPGLLSVLGVVGVLVALGVLVFAGVSLRRARTPGGRGPAGAFVAEAGWTAAQARTAAAGAAAAADYRQAIRYRYLAALLALDESGRLRFDPALTNQEYLRRAPAGLYDPLRPLVQIFDRLWYGGYPATAQDYQDYQALAARAEHPAAEGPA